MELHLVDPPPAAVEERAAPAEGGWPGARRPRVSAARPRRRSPASAAACAPPPARATASRSGRSPPQRSRSPRSGGWFSTAWVSSSVRGRKAGMRSCSGGCADHSRKRRRCGRPGRLSVARLRPQARPPGRRDTRLRQGSRKRFPILTFSKCATKCGAGTVSPYFHLLHKIYFEIFFTRRCHAGKRACCAPPRLHRYAAPWQARGQDHHLRRRPHRTDRPGAGRRPAASAPPASAPNFGGGDPDGKVTSRTTLP